MRKRQLPKEGVCEAFYNLNPLLLAILCVWLQNLVILFPSPATKCKEETVTKGRVGEAFYNLNPLSLFFKLPGFGALDDISPTLQHSFEGYVSNS